MFKGLMLRRIKPVNSHIIQKTEMRLLDGSETVVCKHVRYLPGNQEKGYAMVIGIVLIL